MGWKAFSRWYQTRLSDQPLQKFFRNPSSRNVFWILCLRMLSIWISQTEHAFFLTMEIWFESKNCVNTHSSNWPSTKYAPFVVLFCTTTEITILAFPVTPCLPWCAVVDLGGQLGAIAPPSLSWNRSGAPLLEMLRPYEELTLDISVEEKTPPLSTAPLQIGSGSAPVDVLKSL